MVDEMGVLLYRKRKQKLPMVLSGWCGSDGGVEGWLVGVMGVGLVSGYKTTTDIFYFSGMTLLLIHKENDDVLLFVFSKKAP